MKLIVPDYYKEFRCIADQCRHSCCVGWEIDIDDETLAYYRNLKGEIGDKLRRNIDETEEGANFHLTEEERCPFLTENGLCELILTLGEGALCQICDDHPRFRNFYSDRTEMGLGMCCEAAGRLILERMEKTNLEMLEDDGGEEFPDETEEEILTVREQLIKIAQDRSLAMDLRLEKVAEAAGFPLKEMDFCGWADFLLTLERLDDQWADCLESMKQPPAEAIGPEWDIAMEQLMVYLLYRHLPGALEDGDLSGRIGYVCVIWQLIRQMFMNTSEKTLEELVELGRMYSSEIEYSDENVGAILKEIHRIMDKTPA